MMHKDIKKHYNQAQIAIFLCHFSKKKAFYIKKSRNIAQKTVIFTTIHTKEEYIYTNPKRKQQKKERHPGKRMRKRTIVVIFIYK